MLSFPHVAAALVHSLSMVKAAHGEVTEAPEVSIFLSFFQLATSR
jgi:hypothetical protein